MTAAVVRAHVQKRQCSNRQQNISASNEAKYFAIYGRKLKQKNELGSLSVVTFYPGTTMVNITGVNCIFLFVSLLFYLGVNANP